MVYSLQPHGRRSLLENTREIGKGSTPMTALHKLQPTGDRAHVMRSGFTHHHGHWLRKGFQDLRAHAHLTAAHLWHLRRGRVRQLKAAAPPTSIQGQQRAGLHSRFLFQPEHIVHAGFTLLPLELLFAWITDAKGTRYAMGGQGQDDAEVIVPTSLDCGTVCSRLDADSSAGQESWSLFSSVVLLTKELSTLIFFYKEQM